MADTTKETRIKKFTEEYKVLVEKYRIDTMSYPIWIPSGPHGEFQTHIQTTYIDTDELKQAQEKKPFIAQ